MTINRYVKELKDGRFIVYAGKNERDYTNTEQIMIFANELAQWCKEMTGNEYETWNIDHTGCTFSFDNIDDAMAFKLRWL